MSRSTVLAYIANRLKVALGVVGLGSLFVVTGVTTDAGSKGDTSSLGWFEVFEAKKGHQDIKPITGYPYKSEFYMEVIEGVLIRFVKSNGWPDYVITTATFPNRHCPNTPKPQTYWFEMRSPGQKATSVTELGLNLFGVALNGVPLDPVANEYWDPDKKSTTHRTQTVPKKGEPYWTFEALDTKLQLGLDSSNAHVQDTGAYHYHGMPTKFLDKFRIGPTNFTKSMVLLGYAADGFPIYSCYVKVTELVGKGKNKALVGMKTLRSSWQLRNKGGSRAKGEPSGTFMQGTPMQFTSNNYDGTFTQDFEYTGKKPGGLDECNGTDGVTPEYPGGTYYYVITEEFPFIPRKFRGKPNASFKVH